jgi:hypothetical protein
VTIKPQKSQAGTKKEKALGIRILRIARIQNLMVLIRTIRQIRIPLRVFAFFAKMSLVTA